MQPDRRTNAQLVDSRRMAGAGEDALSSTLRQIRDALLQLDDDQDVEGEDEHEGHREAQDEAVEGERRLAVEDALRWVAHLQQCLWLPCEMNALHFSSEIDVMNFAFCWRVD